MAIGKWIGGALGWILGGGVLGAVAGFCIGTMLDEAINDSSNSKADNSTGNREQDYYRSQNGFGGSRPFEEDRNSFLFSMLVLSSYIIKADGRIMHSEMEFVRQFLRHKSGKDLTSSRRQSAKAV